MLQFPATSPLLGDKTVYRARGMGIQHVNMSPENDIRHFTLFVAVLTLFLGRFGAVWTIRDFTINIGI